MDMLTGPYATALVNFSLAAWLVHWTWRGAARYSLMPGLTARMRALLASYRRYRWIAVGVSVAALLLAVGNGIRPSALSLGLLISQFVIGYPNFIFRVVFGGRAFESNGP